MPSSTYELFVQAMIERKQILCVHAGFPRELCPIILGYRAGEERALAYQFAGESSRRLPPGGDWRCLELAKTRDVKLREGPWHVGSKHMQQQTCVTDVDLDVNPESPYNPRRSLESLRRSLGRRD